MSVSPSDFVSIFERAQTYCFVFAHPPLQRAGVGAHSPPSLIFQENSKKCYSFEMRIWPLVLSCIFIHGLLAIAHLLLEIN